MIILLNKIFSTTQFKCLRLLLLLNKSTNTNQHLNARHFIDKESTHQEYSTNTCIAPQWNNNKNHDEKDWFIQCLFRCSQVLHGISFSKPWCVTDLPFIEMIYSDGPCFSFSWRNYYLHVTTLKNLTLAYTFFLKTWMWNAFLCSVF